MARVELLALSGACSKYFGKPLEPACDNRLPRKLEYRARILQRLLEAEIAKEAHTLGPPLLSPSFRPAGGYDRGREIALLQQVTRFTSATATLVNAACIIFAHLQPSQLDSSPEIGRLLAALMGHVQRALEAVESLDPHICHSAFFAGLMIERGKIRSRIGENQQRLQSLCNPERLERECSLVSS